MRNLIKNMDTITITSLYGDRQKLKWQLKKRLHKGIDVRTYYGHMIPVIIVLPERAKLLRFGFQKKWGWFYVFKPLETNYSEIKFIHMGDNEFGLIKGMEYEPGQVIAKTMLTDYMVKKGIGLHLHFETWMKHTHVNPVYYLMTLGIKYNYSKNVREITLDQSRLV